MLLPYVPRENKMSLLAAVTTASSQKDLQGAVTFIDTTTGSTSRDDYVVFLF